MNVIEKGPLEEISKDFMEEDYRVRKDDHYYIRNGQSDVSCYRSLTSSEIEILVKNNNTAENWDKILVSERFDPELVRNCEFFGMVRIGNLERVYLEYHKLRLPVGISNSMIISCDIGNNAVIRNVRYLSHYVIGHHCVLFNVDEMITVDTAKFGNGIVKQGERENVRIWLEISNENGGRKILPFSGILPADAYIWSRFRHDGELMDRLKEMTDNLGDVRRGFYGEVGNRVVIKNCRIIKDVSVGPDAYIKGANKLKNLTVNSSKEEPTQIGEGVELVNGIIGYGNRIFYGVMAVRFVTGRNVQLKYGARLINSFLGPNSTISCCEVLNNLIFPFHEQHHNNSFLIAATIQGQSNIAAGATIGSNHNSRGADGEIIAKRGFWPGLMSTFKHNSKFASFVLVAKGNYDSEMNIPFPFSLVAPGEVKGEIVIIPAYWFKYNLFALTRNSWKFEKRDKRKVKEQNVEFDYLAPDTVEEMFEAVNQLKKNNTNRPVSLKGVIKKGAAWVKYSLEAVKYYEEMIFYYGFREFLNCYEELGGYEKIINKGKEFGRKWSNIGGQIMKDDDLEALLEGLKSREIKSWRQLHESYDKCWKQYVEQRRRHGIGSLLRLWKSEGKQAGPESLSQECGRFEELIARLKKNVYESKNKDFQDPYRKMVYGSSEEMEAVLGSMKNIAFVEEFSGEQDRYLKKCRFLRGRLKGRGQD